MTHFSLFLISAIFLVSTCDSTSKRDGKIAATAYGNNLYLDDIKGLSGNSEEVLDTQAIISREIDSWLMQQILFNEANKVVGNDNALNQLAQNYRQKIYIHELEKEVLLQNQDKIVGPAEVDTFYTHNSASYTLSGKITRALIVKIPASHDNEELEALWKTENVPALEAFVSNNNGAGILNLDKWLDLEYIKSFLPAELYKKIRFNQNKTYSHSTDTHTYYVKILETIDQGEIAPLSYVREEIKNKLFKENTGSFLKDWKKKLYQNNIQSKNIHVYASK